MHTRWMRTGAALLVGCTALAGVSCGKVVREGRSPAYLILVNLQGASGAKPTDMSNVVQSDVVTLVEMTTPNGTQMVPTVYEDNGSVTLSRAMKDVTNPVGPTSNNDITLSRYHVSFTRADGRNTPGVDVPYAFDGAITGTVGAGDTAFNFVLVRVQAKDEAPLRALRYGGGAGVISTLATVTFYGRDQTGNEVSATGTLSVNFCDWADPK